MDGGAWWAAVHGVAQSQTRLKRLSSRAESESESHSVMSDSLWPHGLSSPWNSPDQNTKVGSLSLLHGIFPTQGWNPGLPHCGQILYQLSHKGSPSCRAAAAKSLQPCGTLWDPIDGSPPGSPIPGILQARTLEWGALSFSNAYLVGLVPLLSLFTKVSRHFMSACSLR